MGVMTSRDRATEFLCHNSPRHCTNTVVRTMLLTHTATPWRTVLANVRLHTLVLLCSSGSLLIVYVAAAAADDDDDDVIVVDCRLVQSSEAEISFFSRQDKTSPDITASTTTRSSSTPVHFQLAAETCTCGQQTDSTACVPPTHTHTHVLMVVSARTSGYLKNRVREGYWNGFPCGSYFAAVTCKCPSTNGGL